MSRRAILRLFVLATVGVCLAVGQAGYATQTQKKAFTIALVPGQTTEPFYISGRYGAEEAAKQYGVKLIWEGSKEWDFAAQTQVVHSLLAKGIDALVIAPTDDKAMVRVIKEVADAGIPVIAWDTSLADTSSLSCEITSDNKLGGNVAADVLARAIGGQGKVIIQNTNPGVTTTDDRQNGFIEAIKAKYPNIKIINTFFCQEDQTKAATQVQSALLANPDIKGIFATCTNATLGAAKGLEMAHRNDVVLVGYDADPAEVEALRKGSVDVLVVQKPLLMGYLAVEYAYRILSGQADYVPSKVLCSTVIATRDNMNDQRISKFFYPTK